MNRRGGAPFIHQIFESHQLAQRAKHTINVPLRPSLGEFGGSDKALRATWARSPPASAPDDMREHSWSLWQLHSFDVHKDHVPTTTVPPPTYPATWAAWYRDKYQQESNVTCICESTACPDEINREYRRQLEGNTEEDAWSELSSPAPQSSPHHQEA